MNWPRAVGLAACFAALLLCAQPHTSAGQYTSLQQNKNTFEGSDRVVDSAETRSANRAANKSEIVLVLLMSTQNELPVYFELVKPTIELATEFVNSRFTQFSIRVKARKDPNSCDANVVGALAAEEYYLNRLDGIIGPICSKALESTARLASYWGVPVITAGGIGVEFSNKSAYRSLTRIAISLGK